MTKRSSLLAWRTRCLSWRARPDSPWTIGKARWVKELAQQLGVPMERTAAIGDPAGDCKMLNATGLSIFVGRTLPAARQKKWLHLPEESIERVAKHLLQAWGLPPNKALQPRA